MLSILSAKVAEPDKIALKNTELINILSASFREAFRSSLRWPASDVVLYSHPWGFSLKNIDIAVHLWHGEKDQIANAVGIGAIKYADYSNNRESDYVFSFDKMLAMEGNTAPYMQYAYARVKSIERKAEEKGVDIAGDLANIKAVDLAEATELELAKHLIRYGEAIDVAAADCRPNYLTAYLYDLAQKFSSFYNACPVLIADESQRPTRVILCDLTARTMRHGLSELLGIEVVEQM